MQPPAFHPYREHPRVGAGFDVQVELGGRQVPARARNLSMAGLLLEGSLELPDRVPMRIPLPGLKREVVTTARVERRGPEGVALSFADIDWADLILMARYLSPRL